MRRITLLGVALLLVTGGIAWAKGEAYKLVMSKNKELCQTVLNFFNEDMKRYKEIRYDDDIFKAVEWKSFKLEEETHGCEFLSSAMFDLDNNGTEDLVLKWRACLRGELSDSLFVFSSSSDILKRIGSERGQLFETPNKFSRTGHAYPLEGLTSEQTEGVPQGIGGIFIIHPFLWKNTAYVSMTDFHQEWIVIAKYLRGEQFQDVCYLHGRSRF